MLLVAVVEQRIEVRYAFENDIATLAAIAAVRTAELNEFLAAETDAAVSPVARADIDFGGIEELHGYDLRRGGA